MKRVYFDKSWKESWKYSYPYDLMEIYGEGNNKGYTYAYENRKKHTLALITNVIKPGDRILDVAAAQGNFSLLLAELGYNVTWNDIREDLVDYVEMKKENGCIEYCPGNVFEIKFDRLFDLVLATEIIEHVAHPDEFLLNLSKLIRPGGYIVISTPLGSYFKNKLPKFTEFSDPAIFEGKQFGPNSEDHIFLLHLDEIEQISKKAGLKIQTVQYYSNPLTSGHIKLSKILRFIPKETVFKIEKFTQRLPLFLGKRIHTSFSVLLQK